MTPLLKFDAFTIRAQIRNRPLALLLSFALALVLVLLLSDLFNWAILNATWVTDTGARCKNGGACWAVIGARYRTILFGLFPYQEQWRPAVACFVTIIAFSAVALVRRLRDPKFLALIWIVVAGTFVILMSGGILGLSRVSSDDWGGLALTLFIYILGITIGFPLSFVLYVARNSRASLLRKVTAVFIDAMRTLPLVALLFGVGAVIPMVVPPPFAGSKLMRVSVAFALAYACYQAEILRGGMEAVSRGQHEAASALGMPTWMAAVLVTFPQGMRNALPSTINHAVATFKETSIVAIVGFFDLTASAQAAYGNADWSNAYIEVYVFVGAIYLIFVLGISRLGRSLENQFRLQ
jgi:general L-amino acid transport system permease protein